MLARKLRRIMVCHDKFMDKATRLELFQEVYKSGGKIIKISGDSSQDPLTALGKVLAQRERWREFFKLNQGMVVVHLQGINYLPREKLIAQVQGVLAIDPQRLKAVKPHRRPKAARKVAIEQLPLRE